MAASLHNLRTEFYWIFCCGTFCFGLDFQTKRRRVGLKESTLLVKTRVIDGLAGRVKTRSITLVKTVKTLVVALVETFKTAKTVKTWKTWSCTYFEKISVSDKMPCNLSKLTEQRFQVTSDKILMKINPFSWHFGKLCNMYQITHTYYVIVRSKLFVHQETESSVCFRGVKVSG